MSAEPPLMMQEVFLPRQASRRHRESKQKKSEPEVVLFKNKGSIAAHLQSLRTTATQRKEIPSLTMNWNLTFLC